MSRRNAWVSYHALALADGLPVQIVKEPNPGPRVTPLTTPRWDLRSRPHQGDPGHPTTPWPVELMGIEPTTSGLQNRRSPS
jgi:hypothetical protein